MRMWIVAAVAAAVIATGQQAAAQEVPAAIFTDPVRDAAHPAQMEVLHILSGGVAINGIAYVATDHGWSDRRIRLESEIVRWLAGLGRQAQ